MSETTRKKDNRIYGFDAIRAFSALYIMGYWHLRNYLSTATNVAMKTHIAYQMVYFCLAGFTFISGYLIYKHHKDSIKDFFLNRVLRIYPLYLLALVSMYLTHYINAKQLVLSLFGLGCFYPEKSPLTLWYVNMIILLYALTAVLFRIPKGIYRLILAILIESILYVLAIRLKIDERLYFFFPFYITGLFAAERVDIKCIVDDAKNYMLIYVTVIMMCACLVVAHFTPKEFTYSTLIGSVCFIICGTAFGTLISKVKPLCTVMMALSYASMTIYMFHRCIYYIAKKAAGTMTVPTAILTIFIIIVIAYLIQFIYDKICSVIIKGRS